MRLYLEKVSDVEEIATLLNDCTKQNEFHFFIHYERENLVCTPGNQR
jgi:hypothetical protein